MQFKQHYEDKYKMTQKDNILFAKRNIVDSIYSEAKLEGIGVTFPSTYEIFNGRAVAGLSVDDTIKINNLKHAWEFILSTLDYPIDLRYIRQINSEVGKGVVFREGLLRDTEVRIGGTTWKPPIPDEEEIKHFIEDVCNNINFSATGKAIRTMLYVMRTQMFYDGNKRTAQLLANRILIENGAGILSIHVEDQEAFIKKLVKYYETGNEKDTASFVYDRCIEGVNL